MGVGIRACSPNPILYLSHLEHRLEYMKSVKELPIVILGWVSGLGLFRVSIRGMGGAENTKHGGIVP